MWNQIIFMKTTAIKNFRLVLNHNKNALKLCSFIKFYHNDAKIFCYLATNTVLNKTYIWLCCVLIYLNVYQNM